MSLPQESSPDSPKETIDLGIYYLDMVPCPIDPKHSLRRHRLPYHLIKCKKNFPDKVQCPFDHFHYIDKENMANHLKVCPHKPRTARAEEMQPHIIEMQNAREKSIKYNYDVNNYQINEPYWD